MMNGKFHIRSGLILLFFVLRHVPDSFAQDYEVADIDCAVGNGGKELISARLRRPDGFRGTPIFADDRGTSNSIREPNQDISKEQPCQIFHDPTDTTGRVFVLRVSDFSQCGVLKRNGFIHVRVWFPQLPGVVMLSDQEVIIMCKPKQPTVTQSKAAGFAGSIPTGARVSGIVEETPGRLEYEVALFRESGSSSQGRSAPGAGAYITGADAQELPVDQAVPIGTRLQLRAKINLDSSWQHAKLMEVSVSPDPKDGNADGSVALIKDGCRNPDLASIIPKQPYRFKDRTNEVVLDFEAFLLSNMGDKNTLWLHTQIKACMEPQDCHPEFCMDVYQPSSFGRKRRDVGTTTTSSMITSTASNGTAAEYTAPLAQHWRTVEGPTWGSESNHPPVQVMTNSSSDNSFNTNTNRPTSFPSSTPPLNNVNANVNVNSLNFPKNPLKKHDRPSAGKDDTQSTKFGENIGFSVVMPAEYYRNAQVVTQPYVCRGWAAATFFSLMGVLIAGIISCFLSYKLRKHSGNKDKNLAYLHSPIQSPITVRTAKDSAISLDQAMSKARNGKMDGHGSQRHHHQPSTKYARDSSLYRS